MASRLAHNQEIAGSNPASASKSTTLSGVFTLICDFSAITFDTLNDTLTDEY